jgi:hypothetical protein
MQWVGSRKTRGRKLDWWHKVAIVVAVLIGCYKIVVNNHRRLRECRLLQRSWEKSAFDFGFLNAVDAFDKSGSAKVEFVALHAKHGALKRFGHRAV